MLRDHTILRLCISVAALAVLFAVLVIGTAANQNATKESE